MDMENNNGQRIFLVVEGDGEYGYDCVFGEGKAFFNEEAAWNYIYELRETESKLVRSFDERKVIAITLY